MARDPQVDLVFAHMSPRYLATGVDPNDLQRLVQKIERWGDWCHIWSEEAARHEDWAADAAKRDRKVTASEANLRASIYYHYAKHLFAHDAAQYLAAHRRMLACYQAAAPAHAARPPVAIILPGLDACKEELHTWCDAFLRRGVATLALDGPGQGETAFKLPITTQWGKVIGAVIDLLEGKVVERHEDG